MRSLALCLTLAVSSTLMACASGQAVDPNTPETCVTVDNSAGGSSAGRVYLVGESRERIRIGEVPLGRTVTHCIRRSGSRSGSRSTRRGCRRARDRSPGRP